MGWLGRLLKGFSSSPPKSKRECRCSESSTTMSNYSGDGSPRNSKKEGSSFSVTNSLSEVSEKVLDENEETVEDEEMNNYSYFGRQEEDEGLALALESYHPYDIAGIFQPYPSFSFACRNCELCHEEVDGWQCFKCMDGSPVCNQGQTINLPFADYEVNYSLPRSLPQTYYNIHPLLRCDVCRELVSVDSSGNPQYKITPIWGQTYCIRHEADGTARCYTCGRLEPFGTKYSLIRDGRIICPDCQNSAITNAHQLQPLIEEIQRFYEGLGMKVYEQFPFELVGLKELNKDESRGTVGRTLPSELPLWTTISRPVFGPGNKLTKTVTELHKLVSYREVKIQVLSDTPRLFTGTTLAHEMLHAWICLHGSYLKIRGRPRELGYLGSDSDKVHEGLCQVIGHMWLESEIHAMATIEYNISPKRLDFERKLAYDLKRQIEEDRDPIYGDGFRLVHAAVTKYGLKGTLDYIRMTGSFPG